MGEKVLIMMCPACKAAGSLCAWCLDLLEPKKKKIDPPNYKVILPEKLPAPDTVSHDVLINELATRPWNNRSVEEAKYYTLLIQDLKVARNSAEIEAAMNKKGNWFFE